MRSTSLKSPGFTIVELLIVIVVIAILAALTVVAFNGVRQRADETRLVTVINAYTKAIKLFKADNGTYPSVTSKCLGLEGDLVASARFTNNKCSFSNTVRNRDDTLNTALSPYMSNPPRANYTEEILDSSNNTYARGIYFTGNTTYYYFEYYIKPDRDCPIGTLYYTQPTMKVCYVDQNNS